MIKIQANLVKSATEAAGPNISSPAVSSLAVRSPCAKITTIPRRRSFVENLKEQNEKENSPRKSKTPNNSPVLTFVGLKIAPPAHLDLATFAVQPLNNPTAVALSQPLSDGGKTIQRIL